MTPLLATTADICDVPGLGAAGCAAARTLVEGPITGAATSAATGIAGAAPRRLKSAGSSSKCSTPVQKSGAGRVSSAAGVAMALSSGLGVDVAERPLARR